MVAVTRNRVPERTSARGNEAIRRAAEARLAYFAVHREEIDTRLRELDQEWDIERLIETEGPLMTGAGLLLGATVSRKWLALPIFAQSMMLLHAVQGFYPMLPLFRALGFRSEAEIAEERHALRALRGDFDGVERAESAPLRAERAFRAASPAGVL